MVGFGESAAIGTALGEGFPVKIRMSNLAESGIEP